MIKDKQLDEMAKLICDFPKCINYNIIGGCKASECNIADKAEAIYIAGYHKQSENTVELPCKIGDKVYRLNYLCTAIDEATVKAIYYTEDKKYYPKSHLVVQYDLARGRVRINFSEIGRTLFFIREEAEKALKGDEGK